MRSLKMKLVALIIVTGIFSCFSIQAKTVFFGIGESFTLETADFATAPSFSNKSKAVAEFIDPVSGKNKTASLKVEAFTATSITLNWDKAVKLYEHKSLKGKLVSSELASGAVDDLEISSLTVDGIACMATLYLSNPYVRNLTLQADGSYAVDGILFGDKKPKVQIEYTCTKKGETNVPGYKSCRVNDFAFVAGTNGASTQTFTFTVPELKEGEISTGYFIFTNKIGIEARKADLTTDQLTATFDAAVQDASVREYGEISKNLKALTPDNNDPELVWDADHKRVKVIVWTGDYWKNVKPGDVITNFSPASDSSLGYFMYVAPYGEVVNYMQHDKFALDKEMNNRLKLAEKLGLQVADGTTDRKMRFLIMWAPPASLFRPAPDAEVDDFEAQLARSYGQVETANTWITKHYDWKIANSYSPLSSAYPFTGFGYTYDWSNTGSEIGFSEFVILPEHEIEVIDNVLTVDFFNSIDD